ncbi:MAG: Rpn family recombination-promoting nuclease/putative transposase [Coriobacteriales bacterium]|jgi:predicted transposase/invertase (TIGR01784 family)|nr:Rpn family recombination-promoting nuclease/putative transposase [Coriobacteriales bacterium]
MRYAPTNNLLFMKCFASPQNGDVLKGFIHDVLGIKTNEVTVENPYDVRHIKKRLAHTVVDVLVRLPTGCLVTIEMQVQPQKHYDKRALYYLTSRYASGYGDKRFIKDGSALPDVLYASLRPVFGVNICNFDLFANNPDPLRSFTLFDTTYSVGLNEELVRMVFLQLPKAALEGQEAIGHWLSFFRGDTCSCDAPDYIRKARCVVEYNNLSGEERTMIDYAEMSREDAKAARLYAWEEGFGQGADQTISQTAQHMLGQGLTLDEVCKLTGISKARLSDLLKRRP